MVGYVLIAPHFEFGSNSSFSIRARDGNEDCRRTNHFEPIRFNPAARAFFFFLNQYLLYFNSTIIYVNSESNGTYIGIITLFKYPISEIILVRLEAELEVLHRGKKGLPVK